MKIDPLWLVLVIIETLNNYIKCLDVHFKHHFEMILEALKESMSSLPYYLHFCFGILIPPFLFLLLVALGKNKTKNNVTT